MSAPTPEEIFKRARRAEPKRRRLHKSVNLEKFFKIVVIITTILLVVFLAEKCGSFEGPSNKIIERDKYGKPL
jgi:hypothetical protein